MHDENASLRELVKELKRQIDALEREKW